MSERFPRLGEPQRAVANKIVKDALEATGVYTVRKGRISLVEFFWDHAEALEAAGLSEQDAHADS